jgi:hypothetical protein
MLTVNYLNTNSLNTIFISLKKQKNIVSPLAMIGLKKILKKSMVLNLGRCHVGDQKRGGLKFNPSGTFPRWFALGFSKRVAFRIYI